MKKGWDLSISESQMAHVAQCINDVGFGMLTGVLSGADLQRLRETVLEVEETPQARYARLQEIDTWADTALDTLPRSMSFINLCKKICTLGTGNPSQDTSLYQVFRCLQGDVAQKHSYLFHYDTYVLTVLVPIIIPEEGMRGDLLLLPNRRPVRRTYLHNLIDKALLDNPLSQQLLKLSAIRKRMGAIRVSLRPGNLYFFWGYRTIHANEPSDPNKIRATALIHFGDPYRGSPTRKFLRNIRRLKSA
jgi:hypothetical protein